MAGDVNNSLDDVQKKAASAADEMERGERALEKQVSMAQKLKGLLGGGAGGNAVANQTSTTSRTANNGGGSGPYSAGGAGPFAPGTTDDQARFKNGPGQMSGAVRTILGGVANAGIAAMSFLPTTQEAVMTQQLGERIRFYSGQGSNFAKGTGAAQGGSGSAYAIQRNFSAAGTALTPTDAVNAINTGTGMGLMSGLSNYAINTNSLSSGNKYSGILGGAALASNLMPGIGLQGGMAAMGSLNQAGNVNMLRMLGVQVRNKEGTTMNDLPQIIEQIYKLLARGKDITPQDIAISMQPGNALNSLLNQYFGGDDNLKQVVLAGLVQMANTKGESLRKSGSKASLQSTGGLTRAVTSTGNRSTAELSLIQSYADQTAGSSIKANNVLQEMYGGLAKGRFAGKDAKGYIDRAQDISVLLSTVSGARGGGGQALMDAMFSATGEAIGELNGAKGTIARAVLGAGGLAAAAKYSSSDRLNAKASTGVVNPEFYGAVPSGMASTSSGVGQLYTGAITINVTAPPGSDPNAWGRAIGDTLTRVT